MERLLGFGGPLLVIVIGLGVGFLLMAKGKAKPGAAESMLELADSLVETVGADDSREGGDSHAPGEGDGGRGGWDG